MGIFKKDNKNTDMNDSTSITSDIELIHNQRLYLVDYENVSDAGLNGIDKLTPADLVIIFYGSKVKSIAYDSLIAITGSSANIEHIKAEKTAKNYLDFQLTTYLGYKLGQNSFKDIYVISKDSGFDAVVDFWSNKGFSIFRQSSIIIFPDKTEANPTKKTKKKNPKATLGDKTNKKTASDKPAKSSKKSTKKTVNADPVRNELRAALKGCGLTAPEYKKVYDAFSKSKSSLNYNNNLQKAFGNDKTSIIYKSTSKIFEKKNIKIN